MRRCHIAMLSVWLTLPVGCCDGEPTDAETLPAPTERPRALEGHEQPLIQGRPLEYWGEMLGRDPMAWDLMWCGGLRSAYVAMAGAFRQFGTEGVQVLIGAVEASDPKARRTAMQILELLGSDAEPALPHLAAALRQDPGDLGAFRAIVGIGDASLPILMDLLRHPDPDLRERAASGVGCFEARASESVDDLATMVRRDPDRDVRRAALRALARIGSATERALLVVIRAVHDRDEWVRRSAAQVLPAVSSDAERVMPALLRGLRGYHDSWHHEFSEAVRPYGAAAVPHLVEFVHYSVGWPQIHAVRALGHLGVEAVAAIPALEAAADDPEERIRWESRRALDAIRRMLDEQ